MVTQMNSYKQPLQDAVKRDGHYIGTLMLVLLVAMEVTFTAVTMVLVMAGVIDFSALTEPYLGFDNTAYLLLYAAVYTFVFLAPTVVVSLCFKRHPLPLTPHRAVEPADGFLSVLGAVGVCILTSVGVSMLMSLLARFGVPMPDLPSMLENTPTSFWLNVLVMAVLPAVLEEALFRGCVLRVLRPYGDWFAIVVSAVLFGLMHGNIIQIPFALVVGIALGWLYVATENIWLPIAVHFANNLLSVSMEYAMLQLDEAGQESFAVLVYGMVISLGVAAILVLTLKKSALFHRFNNNQWLSSAEKVKALLSSAPLLIAVIAFVIMLIVGML